MEGLMQARYDMHQEHSDEIEVMAASELLPGIIYACQFLVIDADQPTLAENLMTESDYSMAELLAEQERTGHETKLMNAVIREAFRRVAVKSNR